MDLFNACTDGTLAEVELKWSAGVAVCVVMASGGYPENYEKGKAITGIADADALKDTKVFHAGTKVRAGEVVTNGGRVLGVTSWRPDLAGARAAAYAAVAKISFEAAHVRTDIASKAML